MAVARRFVGAGGGSPAMATDGTKTRAAAAVSTASPSMRLIQDMGTSRSQTVWVLLAAGVGRIAPSRIFFSPSPPCLRDSTRVEFGSSGVEFGGRRRHVGHGGEGVPAASAGPADAGVADRDAAPSAGRVRLRRQLRRIRGPHGGARARRRAGGSEPAGPISRGRG